MTKFKIHNIKKITPFVKLLLVITVFSELLTNQLRANELDSSIISLFQDKAKELNLPIVNVKGRFEEYTYNEELYATKPGMLRSYNKFDLNIDLSGSSRLYYREEPLGLSITNSEDEFTEITSSYINNGKFWTRCIEISGAKETKINTRKAIITSVPPIEVSADYKTGKNLLLLFAKDMSGNKSIIDIVAEALKGDVLYKVTKDQDIIRIVQDNDCVTEIIELDASRGFVLKYYERQINKCNLSASQVREVREAEEFVQLSENVWLPKVIERRIYSGNELSVYHKWIVEKASVITENQFNDSLKYKFAKGWIISDERFGVEFKIGDEPELIIKNLKKLRK